MAPRGVLFFLSEAQELCISDRHPALFARRLLFDDKPNPALYNLGRTLPDPAPHPGPPLQRRRWTVIGAGLLLLALALVVLYTSRAAFHSPLAMLVVAAIGFAALLLQLRFRKEARVRAPLWLNVLALLCALAAVFADRLGFNPRLMIVAALGAIACFGVSGIVVLRALRKR